MRSNPWQWFVPALLLVFALPAVGWSQSLTGELRPQAETAIQDRSFQVESAEAAAAIRASVGQPLIGITQIPGASTVAAGVWHLTPATVTVSAPVPAAHPGFSLGQNVPNPFENSTRIGFTVPQRDRVTLRVYDVLGRSVSTLVDRNLEPGDYEVMVTANSLSPGVYLYRLQSSQDSITRKLLLLDSGGTK